MNYLYIRITTLFFLSFVCSLCYANEKGNNSGNNPTSVIVDVQENGPNSDLQDDTFKKELIEAKIYMRKGMFAKALNMYEGLRNKYPGNEEVWLGYIETIIELGYHELAFNELDDLMEANPTNLYAKRLQAQIYNKLGMYDMTFNIYDDILAFNRNDAGVLSDYAFSKLSAGNWADSLDYFLRILETNPDNESALMMSKEIIKEHSPNLSSGNKIYTQGLDDETITTYVKHSRHISTNTMLFIDYNHISIDRPDNTEFGLTSIDETIDDIVMRVQKDFNNNWIGQTGIGGYSGLNDGFSFLIGAGYKIGNNGIVELNYFNNKPWFDPLEAVDNNGNFDKIDLSFNWSFLKNWNLFLDVEQLDYSIDDVNDYGKKRGYSGILTKRFELSNKLIPVVYVSYAYSRSIFDYAKEDNRPVALVKSSDRHSFSFNLENTIFKSWSYTLAGSVSKDYARDLEGWSVSPGLQFKIGNRYFITAQYNFASESSNFGGGDTETYNFSLNSIF